VSGFSKAHKRSFTDQKKEQDKIRKAVVAFLVFFVGYLLLVNFIFSMRILESASMNPGLSKGDRLIFLSFSVYKTFPNLPVFADLPVKRGTIVLLDFTERRSFVSPMISSLFRFFSLGRLSFGEDQARVFVKRVIALPGDEVTITNFVARVKPAQDPYTYTEYECADRPYYNGIPENNALWDENVPFSGNMDTVVLQAGEYFVLSDDRSNTNDSRTWGPVPAANIAGKALLRFWPFTGFGVP
jgi:signal peptidase I